LAGLPWPMSDGLRLGDYVMLMADTMAIFFVVLGIMLAFPGLWLLCRGLWPGRVADAAATCSKGLVKPFLVGVPVTLAMILFAGIFTRFLGSPGKLIAGAIVCAYLLLASAGVSGFVTCIGQRLASPGDAERPWKATLRGGVILELSYLLPILGWFVILPISVIVGCGAALLSLLNFNRGAARELSLPRVERVNTGVAGFQGGDPVGAGQ
jgi:hypothetical protein